jgi:kynureninase
MRTREEAARLDAGDPLAPYRDAFALPDGVIYLDGNSLGPPTKSALKRLRNTAEQEWSGGLIRSWNSAGWIGLPMVCGRKIAAVIGAAKDEVLVCDSVSVNLFKLAAAIIAQSDGPVAVDADEFPTDGYILDGLCGLLGAELIRLWPDASPPDGVRLLVKSVVHYKTGAVEDIRHTEEAAQARGAKIIWDLSHAAGLLELNLTRDGARFAVGCGYKFLNGGPGSPAFVYVRSDEAEKLRQPLSGWMGHASPFDFAPTYRPAPGVSRFATGTPAILSMSALDAALDLFTGIDMRAVEAKARALGDLFLAQTAALGLATISPPIGAQRGGHVSLLHDHGYAIMQAMIARGIIGDFRAPNIMRFGFSPLILRHVDVWDAAEALGDILRTEEWREPRFSLRATVT